MILNAECKTLNILSWLWNRNFPNHSWKSHLSFICSICLCASFASMATSSQILCPERKPFGKAIGFSHGKLIDWSLMIGFALTYRCPKIHRFQYNQADHRKQKPCATLCHYHVVHMMFKAHQCHQRNSCQSAHLQPSHQLLDYIKAEPKGGSRAPLVEITSFFPQKKKYFFYKTEICWMVEISDKKWSMKVTTAIPPGSPCYPVRPPPERSPAGTKPDLRFPMDLRISDSSIHQSSS